MANLPSYEYQKGVGLIEVMVALLLLSIAILGFSALQMRSITFTDESLMRTQALSMSRGFIEKMRANPNAHDKYQAVINDKTEASSGITVNSCVSLTATCTDKEIASKEALILLAEANRYQFKLGMVTCPDTKNGDGFSEIKCLIIAWDDTNAQLGSDDADCGDEDGNYKTNSECMIVEAY